MKHAWRILIITLALGVLACESPKPEEAPEAREPLPDDDARRKRAEAIVANAKAREASDELDDVELSAEEEQKIRSAAAAELDESNLDAEINALEIRLQTELGGAPPKAAPAESNEKTRKK